MYKVPMERCDVRQEYKTKLYKYKFRLPYAKSTNEPRSFGFSHTFSNNATTTSAHRLRHYAAFPKYKIFQLFIFPLLSKEKTSIFIILLATYLLFSFF